MLHWLITLTKKNHFPSYFWQSRTDDLCLGNVQTHRMCRSAVLLKCASKLRGNHLRATAGVGGRVESRNIMSYCRLACKIGEVASRRTGTSRSCYRAPSCWRSGIWHCFVIICISLVPKDSSWDQCTTV